MKNWRQIFSWRAPEGEEVEYSMEPDFGEERTFEAPYTETGVGVVYTGARCRKEAIKLFEMGEWEQQEESHAENLRVYHTEAREHRR